MSEVVRNGRARWKYDLTEVVDYLQLISFYNFGFYVQKNADQVVVCIVTWSVSDENSDSLVIFPC